jgi:hypothetical protein
MSTTAAVTMAVATHTRWSRDRPVRFSMASWAVHRDGHADDEQREPSEDGARPPDGLASLSGGEAHDTVNGAHMPIA